MNFFRLLLYTLPVLMFCCLTGCIDDHKGTFYAVRGQIFEDCHSNIPLSNTLLIMEGYIGFPKKKRIFFETHTDENGDFMFTYYLNKHRNPSNDIPKNNPESGFNMGYIVNVPHSKSVDLGILYAKPYFYTTYRLQPTENYTIQDTLFIGYDTVVGPFSFNQLIGPKFVSKINIKVRYEESLGVGEFFEIPFRFVRSDGTEKSWTLANQFICSCDTTKVIDSGEF